MGRVNYEKPSSVESTLKKKRCSDGSPKSSKRRHSSKPTSDDLKSLDEKWSERFSRLEALLLNKSFAVPVEPVKPSTVVTREHPFFEPGASSSVGSALLITEGASPSLVQTTGEAAQLSATQPPLGVPGTNAVQDVCKSATRPVQGPGTSDVATQPSQAPGAELATQPLQASGAGTATQPTQAPGAGPEVLPTGIDSTQLNQSLPGVRPDEFAGESDSEAEMDREPVSPASANAQGELPEDTTDHDLSEEANYRETIRGVRSFMGWHQIPDFDSASSSLDDNPFAGSRAKPTGKVFVKLPVDEWLCRKFDRLNVTVAEGYPSRNTETGGLLRDQFVKPPRSSKWYDMHTDKKDSASTTVCNWSPEPGRLNSTFSRVARRSLPSAPASRTFSQDTLRRWERAFWEQSVMYNQAAGLPRCFLCRSLEFCKYCHKCPNCCRKSTCRGKGTSIWGEMGISGFESKINHNTERGLHPPLWFKPNLTRSLTVISNYVNPQRQSHNLEALYQLTDKNAMEPVANQNTLGFYNRLFLVPKPNNLWRPVLDLSTLNTFLHRVVQDGDPRDNKNLPTGRGVGHLHRLQGRILPYTNSQSVQEVHAFSYPGSVLPVQGPTLWPVHSTHGVHSGGQRGQTDGFTEGYMNPPVPRRLVGESHIPPNLSPAYTDLGSSLSRTRLAGPKRVPRPLFKQHSPGSHRQHNSGCLYQQRRGDEVGLPMCPTVENPVLVHQETCNSQGTSHPRPAERDSRQAIQTWPDHSDRVVPSPRGVSSHMLPVAPTSSRLVCHQIQQQTPTVCVTGSRPPGLGSGCLSWENLDPYAFPTAAILGKVMEKLQDYPCSRIILIAPGWPNKPWLCQLTCQSADIMSSLCGVGVRVNNFFSKTIRPRDMLFFFKRYLIYRG